MSTSCIKPSEIQRKWILIDAENLVVGRLASKIALLLRGKHKPYFSPNLDCGDYVIVVNADKVALTGNQKMEQRRHIWHTGHPGGIKERKISHVLSGRFPERVVTKAVERMLKRNNMGRICMRKLFVYAGAEHPHAAQQPEVLDFGALNRKNKRKA